MKSILITGGVGDAFTIESLMTDEERQSINCILYATRAAQPILQLFENLPSFPNLKTQAVIWKNFDKIFCFHNKKHITDKLCAYQPNALQEITNKLMEPVIDYSIEKIFTQPREYTYSSFVRYKLTDINFALPANYYCVCPYSNNDKRNIRRDYNSNDWDRTLHILKSRGMYGVVINIGNELIPENPCLINLNNKTNIKEAVEVVKHAQGYIGIDSAFSVIAAKIFPPENISIKSLNEHCYKYAHIYFKPLKSFDFLKEQIRGQ